ncbi:hypothetical protein WDU94_010186 [Cyamophila willieti]
MQLTVKRFLSLNPGKYDGSTTFCLNHKDCDSCLSQSQFNCSWCPSTSLCSLGNNKNFSAWTQNDCEGEAITETHSCLNSVPGLELNGQRQTDMRITQACLLIFILIFYMCYMQRDTLNDIHCT